jgi:hypothetical protein
VYGLDGADGLELQKKAVLHNAVHPVIALKLESSVGHGE